MIYDAIEQPKNQPEFHSDRHQRGRNWASLKTALQSTATEEKCNECFFEQAYDRAVEASVEAEPSGTAPDKIDKQT